VTPEQPPHWRVRVLAWGNLALAAATPIGVLVNILAALNVFSVEWAQGSIFLASLFGLVLGTVTGASGWAIRRNRPGAFKLTCIAGGLTVGYTVMGISTMLTAGLDRTLEILIRHGSDNWWDWSLSHFQNSVLRETPILAWWILALGTAVRFRLPGAPEKMKDRVGNGLVVVFVCAMVGGIARFLQLAQDTLLSSQR
jgi:hypothetical protein